MKAREISMERLYYSYINEDADAISEYFSKNSCKISFEPIEKGGKISNDHRQIMSKDWKMWTSNWIDGVRLPLKNASDSNYYVIYLAKRGQMLLQLGRKNIENSNNNLFIAKISEIDRVDINPGRDHIAISLNKSLISKQLSYIVDDLILSDIIFKNTISLENNEFKKIACAMEFTSQYLYDDNLIISPIFYKNIFDAFTCLLIEILPNNFSDRIGQRVSPAMPRHLRRALDYIHAHASAPITVVDIATAAGTSVRSLQSAFLRFRDTTPLNYLRTYRLHIAREKLKKSECRNVAETARACGFTHLGRFSYLYHEAFGEYPSDTLKVGTV